MIPLHTVSIPTNDGEKIISVYAADVIAFNEQIDILTASAYYRSYNPTPGTMFCALDDAHLSVYDLSKDPEIDLRELCNIWLSKQIDSPLWHIRRLGCIELTRQFRTVDGKTVRRLDEAEMLKSVKAYFQMLDVAAVCGIKMDTVALPALGSGRQRISTDLIMIPLLNECVRFLKRNSAVKRIFFIERNAEKAAHIAQTLASSHAINSMRSEETKPLSKESHTKRVAFISYSSKDRNVADNLCAKLEAMGIQVWYAPRNVHDDYATAIAQAIREATHFVVILSKNSLDSQHVLNELDLAFKRLPNDIKFKPLRIDDKKFTPAFNYYLSRQHWMDAYIPPLEERLSEFVEHFTEN